MVFQPPLTPPRIYLRQQGKFVKKVTRTGNVILQYPSMVSMLKWATPDPKIPCFTLAGGVTGFYWDADRVVHEFF